MMRREIPWRKRRRVSEEQAWYRVHEIVESLRGNRMIASTRESLLGELTELALTMRTQVARGIHTNPPERTEKWVPVQTFGKNVDAILYQHVNGKRFRHDFSEQVEMIAMESADGMNQAVLLRPVGRYPIWKDFL